jgi:hypothetical protein
VIDSGWESESFVGFRNFTLMADLHFKVSGNYIPAIDSISRSNPSLFHSCQSAQFLTASVVPLQISRDCAIRLLEAIIQGFS